jgi:uroporphyrinogen-III synthase
MKGGFEVRVVLKRLPLSRASVAALKHLDRYDAILFTSKNARRFFMQELRRRRFAPPRSRIIHVGPRRDLMKFHINGKRVLFPRSAIAPSDIVRALRARDTIVRVIPFYTTKGAPLSRAQKDRLLQGKVKRLYFKSPSGIRGLLAQFRGRDREAIRSIPARCIGATTAVAAREAGFKRVFIR